MNADTIRTYITTNTDATSIVTLTDGTTLTGVVATVNSKGINVRVDGKIVTRSLAKVDSVVRADAPVDGMTSADLADMFNTSAKALRVELRKLGLGVGKGQRYALSSADIARVRDHMATVNADATADTNA